MSITKKVKLWKYQAETAAWYFVSFQKVDIKKLLGREPIRKGWGQIRVEVTIGSNTWKTSLFPSKKHGYDLPIKADVRKKEGIDAGDTLVVKLVLA